MNALARSVFSPIWIGGYPSRVDLLDQASQHPSDFMKARVQCRVLLVGQKSKVAGEEKEVLQLARRTGRNVEKLAELQPAGSCASFRNVSWYRSGCPSHLAGYAEALMFGKYDRCGINSQNQGMALLPDLELLKILHFAPPTRSFICSYLQLITNNCQRPGAANAN